PLLPPGEHVAIHRNGHADKPERCMLAAVFKRQRDQNTLRSRSELLLIPSCDVYPSRSGKPERAVGFAAGSLAFPAERPVGTVGASAVRTAGRRRRPGR